MVDEPRQVSDLSLGGLSEHLHSKTTKHLERGSVPGAQNLGMSGDAAQPTEGTVLGFLSTEQPFLAWLPSPQGKQKFVGTRKSASIQSSETWVSSSWQTVTMGLSVSRTSRYVAKHKMAGVWP